jgi:carbohydrate-binding DOMON domain-containing protein
MACYNDPIIFFSGWILQVWLKVEGHDGIKSSKKIRTLMTEVEGLDNICREKPWTKTKGIPSWAQRALASFCFYIF